MMPHVAPTLIHAGPHHNLGDFKQTACSTFTLRANYCGEHNGQTSRGWKWQSFEQYAGPIPQGATTFAQDHRQQKIGSNVKQAEHMLRRKTPSGTLSAAYDGTAVEDCAKPPATKYVRLGLLNGEHEFRVQNIDFASGGTHIPAGQTPFTLPRALPTPVHGNRQITTTASWVPNVAHDNVESKWPPNNRQQYQVDSVLNQVPVQAAPIYYQHPDQQIPLAIQPAFQAPLGLTALENQPLWGPFWPNGTYVPYRPAAARDPRYRSNTQETSIQHDGPAFELQHLPNWHAPSAQGLLSSGPNDPSRGTLRQPPSNHVPYRASAPRLSANYVPFSSPCARVDRALNQAHIRSNVKSQPRCVPAAAPQIGYSQPFSHCISDKDMPTSSHPLSHSAMRDYRPQAQPSEYMDKVMSWAHNVYLDLLASLQQAQQSNQQGHITHGHRGFRKANIYPRPPRQPASSIPSSCGNSAAPFGSVNGMGLAATQRDGKEQSKRDLRGCQDSIFTPKGEQDSSSLTGEVGALHGNDQEHLSQVNNPYKECTDSPISRHTIITSRNLPPMVENSVSQKLGITHLQASISTNAVKALDLMENLCRETQWQWVDGMLLSGCLAYGLGDYRSALEWYSKVIQIEPNNVEAISNLAATLLALDFTRDAEECWRRAIALRPSYFEAVEHLVGLLCGSHRGKEAIALIDLVENSLRLCGADDLVKSADKQSECSITSGQSLSSSVLESSDAVSFDFDSDTQWSLVSGTSSPAVPSFGSSGYAIPGSDNGRLLALIHAKGNMLYGWGDSIGAATAFENAVLISIGRCTDGIRGLINQVLTVVCEARDCTGNHLTENSPTDPVLLAPEMALQTARLCFPHHGELPGLKDVPTGMAKKAAIATTSNSLLSLAKIFQDGMSSSGTVSNLLNATCGVREILALYYLSLALQPSPSTANNVGILLASVQQGTPSRDSKSTALSQVPSIPGVVPGSGIALALAYYNYGLNLDARHAHLFTNLGSLLKDIGQLNAAIKMYEKAVACDGNFDIALANLANAVKDQGRISDAITYYERAVRASPEFAEAVCGLANALSSVCSWKGRGGIVADGSKRDRWHVDAQGMLLDGKVAGAVSTGWIKRVVDIVETQLAEGETWGLGVLHGNSLEDLVNQLCRADEDSEWHDLKKNSMRKALTGWAGQKWEGAKIVRLVERAIKRLGWQWYHDKYIKGKHCSPAKYSRPRLPGSLAVPGSPTVLPFHTFTCPVSAKQVRQISQRNGLRISCSTLRAPWLPGTVYCPPPPPRRHLNVGYVSSDFNNHPLAHLMQSVFGFHDPSRVKAFCYATAVSDNSVHRQQIEKEAPVFHDASSWPAHRLIKQIVDDEVHILVNLNGYTRGAKNEIFAARPAPVQMAFMGFAGTLGAEWCDYLLADDTAVPPETVRPWRRNVDLEDAMTDDNCSGDQGDWVYGENIIYCRDTFFCCDHRQSAPDAKGKQCSWDEEQKRRWAMRKELFPGLSDDAIIFGNFNQLYKIEPTTFRTWLRILARVPKSILWLLRFPDLGEQNLKSTALLWAGQEVASRVLFTDVAPKHKHIERARVCDLFLDTPECNAHTTAADVLWSGTPLLTLPRYKYKMCSRMAASILKGALPKTVEGKKAAKELIAGSDEEYEDRAVKLGNELSYSNGEMGKGKGRLVELRRMLYGGRWTSALFDTRRWVRDLEDAYEEAWRKWVAGEGGDIWLEQLKGERTPQSAFAKAKS